MNDFAKRTIALVFAAGVLGALAWQVTGRTEAIAAESSAGMTGEMYTDRVMGNPNAPVKIVEYFSLTCPHCAKFEQETLPKLKADYIDTGKVYYISRDFPFDKPGLQAAEMTRCVSADQYFALVDQLFRSQQQWALASNPLAAIKPLGKFAGLSDSTLDACFDNKELETFILNNRKTATDTFKVESTPTFVINNGADKIEGAVTYDKFKASIDALLAKK